MALLKDMTLIRKTDGPNRNMTWTRTHPV